jgi:hypothetical protein
MKFFFTFLVFCSHAYAQRVLPNGFDCLFTRMKDNKVLSEHRFTLSKNKTSHQEKLRLYSFDVVIEGEEVKVNVMDGKNKVSMNRVVKNLWTVNRDPQVIQIELKGKEQTAVLVCR